MIRNKVMQNQQGIASDLFNKAADSYNKAVEKYNFYIQCKNKQFDNMSMKDDKILALLSSTRQLVESAGQTLAHIKSDNFDLNRSIDSMEKSIAGMKKNLDTEDAFVGKYVKTLKPVRLFLFYKKNE